MNLLRVILATLVIFVTGACTGYLVARKPAGATAGKPTPSVLASTNAPADWNKRREEMRASLQKEIKATDEQMAKVDEILSQSRKRSRDIWQTIKVPLEEEVDRVKEEIRGVLDPEQAARYEEIMKHRNRFGPGHNNSPKKNSDPQSCRLNFEVDRQCFL